MFSFSKVSDVSFLKGLHTPSNYESNFPVLVDCTTSEIACRRTSGLPSPTHPSRTAVFLSKYLSSCPDKQARRSTPPVALRIPGFMLTRCWCGHQHLMSTSAAQRGSGSKHRKPVDLLGRHSSLPMLPQEQLHSGQIQHACQPWARYILSVHRNFLLLRYRASHPIKLGSSGTSCTFDSNLTDLKQKFHFDTVVHLQLPRPETFVPPFPAVNMAPTASMHKFSILFVMFQYLWRQMYLTREILIEMRDDSSNFGAILSMVYMLKISSPQENLTNRLQVNLLLFLCH